VRFGQHHANQKSMISHAVTSRPLLKTRTITTAGCWLLVLLGAAACSALTAAAEGAPQESRFNTRYRWDFNSYGNTEGWTIPDPLKGAVMGGSLWLTFQREPPVKQPPIAHQIWGSSKFCDIDSPKGLGLPAQEITKVRMRILNLSPETDGFLFWRTKEKPDVDSGRVRFTMKPSLNQWQVLVCDVDTLWKGIIDQIRIRPALLRMRGDMWIDWIAITDGSIRPAKPRPDVCSDQVVPRVTLPGISQSDFKDAFKILDECLICNVPVHGFNYPVMGPGGAYGENWWQLDSSLNLSGAKWVNQGFAENVIRGFIEVQANNPDGRIDLWGGSPVRGQVADMSSIPRYFEVAYDVVCRSADRPLCEATYESMKKYLGFWLSPSKTDGNTSLVTGAIEDSFAQLTSEPQTEAEVDLNVAVALGCRNTAQLARRLNKPDEAQQYEEYFDHLRRAINQHLWNEKKGAYYNLNVKENKHVRRLICSTFDPLRLGIAPDERVQKLIPLLLDSKQFNWGIRPVTSIAMTDEAYVEAKGPYDGRAWLGDIWTMRNLPIIAGLCDVGRHDLAAELNWSTIRTFNTNCTEYVVPSTGSGEGVARYGWSASQYIQCIVEYLFGVDYDRLRNRLRIVPHVPPPLLGQRLALERLILPTGTDTRLQVQIDQPEPGWAQIQLEFEGRIPEGVIEVWLPADQRVPTRATDARGKSLRLQSTDVDLKHVRGVTLKPARKLSVRFE
jgi:hypothetical protein